MSLSGLSHKEARFYNSNFSCTSPLTLAIPRVSLVERFPYIHSHGHLRSPLPGRWYVYYHTSPAWVTIDRLRSGRDIRLSTATMRALNSRRPQLTSILCLFPRSLLWLLLLLFVFHGGRARSVPRDEESPVQPGAKHSAIEDKADIAPKEPQVNSAQGEPVQGKLAPEESHGAEDEEPEIEPEKPRDVDGKISQPKAEEGDKFDESPRENVSASLQDLDPEKEKEKRIDLADDEPSSDGDAKIDVDAGDGDADADADALKQEDEEASVAKKRRRNDVALIGKSDLGETDGAPGLEKIEDEGIRRFDVQVDGEGVGPSRENVNNLEDNDAGGRKRLVEAQQVAEPKVEEDGPEKEIDAKQASVEIIPPEAPITELELPKEIPGDSVQLKERIPSNENSNPEDNKESNKDREFRYLDDSPSKSRRKSSTVYLNAEEKKIPDGEQQSIVEGQIKKLISIRNDALGAQNTDKLDETKLLNSKRNVGVDEVTITQENVQNEQSNKSGRAHSLHQVRLIAPETVVYNILQDALESYPSDETLVSYVNPENETLKELLSPNQLGIIQMGEKLLPLSLRQEYSDRMFSCVRRFEYFSCIKYFAWPMIKQYFPTLPAFPDYPSWNPGIDLYPQYPILPFPSFSGDVGELPEVVDADATRTRKPRPEVVIIQVLQRTLKEQPLISTSPSFLDRSADSYGAPIPQDQLLTINMAEQLIPVSYRPEFVQKSVNCMKEYNYLSCIKYSTWPTVRQFIPTLPDISGILPDFQIPGISDIVSYVPEIPSYPDLSSYWPIGSTSDQQAPATPTFVVLKNGPELLTPSNELEAKIMETLLKVRESLPKSSEVSPFLLTGNVITFTTFTKSQLDILRAVECLIPPVARPALVTEVLVYLQKNDNFIDCARYVMWPTIARYVANLPEFPIPEVKTELVGSSNSQQQLEVKEIAIKDQTQERVGAIVEIEKAVTSRFQDKESRDKAQQNVPVISVTGTRFDPLFSEHPESVIFNILRSVQLQALNLNRGTVQAPGTKNQQFLDLITEQQQNIVNIVDSLLPQGVRTEFASQLIECLRINNFLVCTRDVIWPTMSQYFPWLPSFPDFGSLVNTSVTTPPPAKQNLTEVTEEVRPLAETNVKTDLAGDTTVTITDTRFYPIFNEVPESVIQNILRSVQVSAPNLPSVPSIVKSEELGSFVTEQQVRITQIAESLLPVPLRPNYLSKMSRCLKDKTFMECTRDITWPTIAEIYPFLPNFPNFGEYQNTPRIKFRVFLEKSSSLEGQTAQNKSQKTEALMLLEAEERIENILLNSLDTSSAKLGQSYLDVSNLAFYNLTKRQDYIIRLIEAGMPEPIRAVYVANMLECTRSFNFVACVQNTGWPTLKQYISSLPDISNIVQPPQLTSVPQLSLERLPSLPNLDAPETTVCRIFWTGSLWRPISLSVSNPRSLDYAVSNQGAVPGYAGQPPGILIDISKEKVPLHDVVQQAKTDDSRSSSSARRRRSVELSNIFYEIDGPPESPSSSSTFPNITESEYLQLLIKVRETVRASSDTRSESKDYFVDTLNGTIRGSLTADQYEILKVVEDLDHQSSSRGLAQQVIQCITGASFIRCLGIFIWPLIVSNLPSLPSLSGFGIFGRSLDTEQQVQELFGMSTSDVEKELLTRKEAIENLMLDWYEKLVDEKFQTNLAFLKITGYGNGELGISFSGFREGRGAKLKDNKNLPSILTIISDIMEEVLDQRPEGEKPKKDKEKRERSIDSSRESDIQFLKDSEEYVDIKRSMNDDEIITMFLNKIKNDSDADDDNAKYFGLENAYDAFGVLFGPRLHSRLANKLQNLHHGFRSLDETAPSSEKVDIVSVENGGHEPKVLSLKSQAMYDLEKESSRDQEEKQRQKRAKNLLKTYFAKHSGNYLTEPVVADDVNENRIIEEEEEEEKEVEGRRSGLIVKLPRLDDEILPRKMTSTIAHLGRTMKDKMMQMMPAVGVVLSFLLQMAVAHARAAASMAGMISNMAMGSAVIGMIRDTFFGGNRHPQIKYVYDNDKVGPSVSWPINHGPVSGSRYRGL
ncbi:uncharacterized protein LOC128892453 [Hylaeus anthracinus]|uniref:uncharacterized protein LOC128892453 n=1 Tax=Hylaeus anthracinus TaxID=313031 RepID=UPI0023B886B5|nr:uncharacterized protein LOC128892453 [Hylaeus anthracinus]